MKKGKSLPLSKSLVKEIKKSKKEHKERKKRKKEVKILEVRMRVAS
jgi:hypothetical protein